MKYRQIKSFSPLERSVFRILWYLALILSIIGFVLGIVIFLFPQINAPENSNLANCFDLAGEVESIGKNVKRFKNREIRFLVQQERLLISDLRIF